MARWHPQASFPTNAASSYTQNPAPTVLAFMLHMFMYLAVHPDPVRFGGPGCTSLKLGSPTVAPFTAGAKEWGLHAAVDASILEKSISGGNIMLAGARISTLCQRQHLAAPDANAAELVAAELRGAQFSRGAMWR